MTERRERDAVIVRAEADIDALFRPLARGVGASVRKHAGEGMTPLARVQILRDVDALLRPVFGDYRGHDAGLLPMVANRSREARAAAFGLQVARLRRVLPVSVQRAVGLADGR